MSVEEASDVTITGAELAWVLRRHGSPLDAADLIGEISDHRDSDYEEGEVYADPEGNKWHFGRAEGDGSPYWLRPGIQGPFEVGIPRRPLRRLVPEGEP